MKNIYDKIFPVHKVWLDSTKTQCGLRHTIYSDSFGSLFMRIDLEWEKVNCKDCLNSKWGREYDKQVIR
jgi:hypothetical protein